MKLILFLAAVLSTNLAASEVYKCKDQAGKSLYQDTPCQNGQQKVLKDLPSNSIKVPPIASAVATPNKVDAQKPPEQSQNPAPTKQASTAGSANCNDERYRNSEACQGDDLLRNKERLSDRLNEKPRDPVKPQQLPARKSIAH